MLLHGSMKVCLKHLQISLELWIFNKEFFMALMPREIFCSFMVDKVIHGGVFTVTGIRCRGFAL